MPDSVSGTLDAQKSSRSADPLTIVSTDTVMPDQMKQARLLLAAQ